jgi:hypothetical protein
LLKTTPAAATAAGVCLLFLILILKNARCAQQRDF